MIVRFAARSALVGLGVGIPTSGAAWVMGAASGGGGEALVYGIPAAAVVGFLSMVYKLLWTSLDDERKGRDADRQAHSAEIARMNSEAIERAERVTTLLVEVNGLLPPLLEVTKMASSILKARAPAKRATRAAR